VSSYDVSASRLVPGPVERVFDVVLPTPLPVLFSRRFGPIPAIREVRDQDGPWASVGQTRTIVLADGGRMQEQLTEVDRPAAFGYRLTDIHGPMRPLVAGVEGRWSFTADGARTRVTWSWRLRATPLGRPLMPAFGWCWRRYAERSLAAIDDLVAAP
jgi:hypothetical protein